jgi:hypothetical protein
MGIREHVFNHTPCNKTAFCRVLPSLPHSMYILTHKTHVHISTKRICIRALAQSSRKQGHHLGRKFTKENTAFHWYILTIIYKAALRSSLVSFTSPP